MSSLVFFFFFNDTATTEIYTNLNTLSLHDALPICIAHCNEGVFGPSPCGQCRSEEHTSELQSHSEISYAVFCLKKKKKKNPRPPDIHDNSLELLKEQAYQT